MAVAACAGALTRGPSLSPLPSGGAQCDADVRRRSLPCGPE